MMTTSLGRIAGCPAEGGGIGFCPFASEVVTNNIKPGVTNIDCRWAIFTDSCALIRREYPKNPIMAPLKNNVNRKMQNHEENVID
jgi:hypothetical protein